MKRFEVKSLKQIDRADSRVSYEIQLLAEKGSGRFDRLEHLSWTRVMNPRSGERVERLYGVGYREGIRFHLVILIRSTPRVATFAETNPTGR